MLTDLCPDPRRKPETGLSRAQFQHGNCGFTLVELVVAIAIIGIALAIALPSFSAWIQNTKVRSAAESMLSGIQTARMEAVRRNARVRFQLNPETNVLWRVSCVNVVAAPASPECPADILSRASSEGGSTNNLTITPATIDIQFDGFGRKVTPAGLVTAIQTKHSSIAESEIHPLRVSVRQNGAVRVCDTILDSANPRGCRAED